MRLALILLLLPTLAIASEPRYPRVLFFHGSSCPPCRAALHGPDAFPPWLKKAGWTVDESTRAHVQLVSTDQRQDLVALYGVRQIPAMVLLTVDGASAPVTYSGRASLLGMFR